MRSILERNQNHCFICGSCSNLEIHHVLYGNPNRKLSDKYKLTVTLCRKHHTGNEPGDRGVHFDKAKDLQLKQYAQRKAMEFYGWSEDEFREIFGKNYL